MTTGQTLRFKKLHTDARLPKQAHDGDAGYDLHYVGPRCVVGLAPQVLCTGVAIEIPKGWVGLAHLRSGMAFKTHLDGHNGVIDSTYRGEVKFIAWQVCDFVPSPVYETGDRIGQLVIVPHLSLPSEWADELSDTSRGDAGYGSTGK